MPQHQKQWWKRIEVVLAFIIAAGTSIVYITKFSAWAQDTTAKSVVEKRKSYFVEDHQPLYDSVKSTNAAVVQLAARSSKRDTTLDIMYYMLQEMASNDQRIRAERRLHEDQRYRMR